MSEKSTEARIAILEHNVNKLSHDLFGNGQPGRLANIDRNLNELKEQVQKLSFKLAILVGVLGAALGASGSKLVSMLVGGG